MNVPVVDAGVAHVKILATGQEECREFPSGPILTAEQMIRGVKELAGDWKYDAVSIGYRGRSCTAGRLPNRITSPRVESGLTMEQRLGAQSRSSIMRPCKLWGATSVARCSSWAWELN
jgi:hypothetical protein